MITLFNHCTSDNNVAKFLKQNYNFYTSTKHKNCLTKAEQKYLTDFDWNSSNFYVNPKIHKSKEIETNITNSETDYIHMEEPADLKSRPIVASCNSPATHRLSTLIEIILKPLVPHLTTFIKDDWHFLRLLPKTLSFEDTILYNVDIVSLYTSITHELGIEAIDYWIHKSRTLIPERFTSEFLLESLEFLLKNNNFIFDDQLYNQLQGTAMGMVAAPPYACLVLGYLEETKLFPTLLPKYFNKEQCKTIKNYFKRYMDDGFIPFDTSIDINTFISYLNEMHPSIKFTYEKAEMSEK